ncbi:MAG: alginate O-acetyltransferase [Alphaproteobacteria bacterium]
MPDDSFFGPPWLARINAAFMVLVLIGGLAALVATGLQRSWPGTELSFVDGEWTLRYERGMDDGFATRDAAVTTWGAIEWGLFGEGRRGVVPGRDGWLFTVEEFEQPDDAEAAIAAKLAAIVAARDRLAAAGVPRLVVALLPDKSRVNADMLDAIQRRPEHAQRYQAFRGALREAGIVAPDLLTPLADAAAAGTQTHMRTDTHWTPAGAVVVAEALAAAIAAGDDPPPSLGAAAFATAELPPAAHDGDLTRFIPLGPLRTLLLGPPEELVQRQTAAADSTDGGDADALLFGDVTIPAVLVGTSYSAMDEWNFDGALQQALGMDVLNLADEGKGPMEPMAAYLASDALRDSPPEIVIWEVPERFLPVAYDLPADAFAQPPDAAALD